MKDEAPFVPWEVVEHNAGFAVREHLEGKHTRYPFLVLADKEMAEQECLKHNRLATFDFDGLAEPGKEGAPCPWFTDHVSQIDRRRGLNGVDYVKQYAGMGMWYPVAARAAMAAAWWKTQGDDMLADRWLSVFAAAMEKITEAGYM